MLVLVDLRVLEEEGENRDGRWSNLNKKHFFGAGSWVGVRSVVSRSSLGGRRQGIREVKEKENLKKSAFFAQAQVVSLKRGDGSGAAVAAHGVSGGERKARNTRRNIAEHRTSIGSNKCICWADAAIEKRRNVLAVDSWLITRSELRNFSPTRTEWADFEESVI